METTPTCRFCGKHTLGGTPFGGDLPVVPYTLDDFTVKASYLDGKIVIYRDYVVPSAYFGINYCPMCGRRVGGEET